MEEHPFSFIASLAERRIAEAREAGAFDNLPGYGKPLTLEDDSHIPPELRMSYRILKMLDISRRNWQNARKSTVCWTCWKARKTNSSKSARCAGWK